MGPYEPKQHKVVIMKRGNRATVWPPYLVAAAGDYVTFSTIGVSAKIEFPNYNAFMPENPDHQPTSTEPKWSGLQESKGYREGTIRMGQNEGCRVRLQDLTEAMESLRTGEEVMDFARNMLYGDTQVYAYSVFCKEINDFAEGNSSPVIMVEPPGRP